MVSSLTKISCCNVSKKSSQKSCMQYTKLSLTVTIQFEIHLDVSKKTSVTVSTWWTVPGWLLVYFVSWHLGWISNWIVAVVLNFMCTTYMIFSLQYDINEGANHPWAPNIPLIMKKGVRWASKLYDNTYFSEKFTWLKMSLQCKQRDAAIFECVAIRGYSCHI